VCTRAGGPRSVPRQTESDRVSSMEFGRTADNRGEGVGEDRSCSLMDSLLTSRLCPRSWRLDGVLIGAAGAGTWGSGRSDWRATLYMFSVTGVGGRLLEVCSVGGSRLASLWPRLW